MKATRKYSAVHPNIIICTTPNFNSQLVLPSTAAIPKLCASAPRHISKYRFFFQFVYYSFTYTNC